VVNPAYKIKDVADRSGFSTATLRYYEKIGLLPEAARTETGYRLYDDRTLDRLSFITRAKQLGCTLDEIADLITAWDGGRCGPVQDRLRALVADKLVGAQLQIAELLTLTIELQRAATALELHRPDGACDEMCGCVSDAMQSGAESAPVSLSMSSAPSVDGAVPVACTLGAESLKGRVEEWQSLLAHVERRESIDGGVRATFGPSTPLDELMRLAAAEHDCCQFFAFAITIDSRGLALEVRAAADAQPVVTAVFGAAA
jgi:MerR family transcriptional regulator, copper efflux regulator